MSFLPDDFDSFLAADCDRERFITNRLAAAGVTCAVVPIDGSRHLFVQFPQSAYNPLFRIKTVLVHYDRAQNSPGANDNSAAVFQIADWAVRLTKRNGIHNVRIFFTDGEELGSGDGVASQGSFGIAAKFRSLGIVNDDVYVFDCCGRGGVPVLSKAGTASGGGSFRSRFASLTQRTEKLLRTVSARNWVSLPVPYSDNAGFLACGIPAVALTVLPAEEATRYMRELQRDKTLESAVMRHTAAAEKLPPTWRLLHTEYDNRLSLTEDAFVLMRALLDELASVLVPV
ncbi:M28 family peptidase [Treponema brennaborense]|uniref:Peptidase M28 domain-containing protein n=1 Tax=Treponema brennaborense (strain DSM 12168 / CIP 105900 / DD5/3) TaxID=906968 RepID=F4LIL6_TREBD|nr:M28 family peptidase [Treponema brennaborense]AEE17241.1 hypothetical protein Trebr_1821 [Treponema brennaborense DSM 12168]